jgi:hypothetical protein
MDVFVFFAYQIIKAFSQLFDKQKTTARRRVNALSVRKKSYGVFGNGEEYLFFSIFLYFFQK